MDALTQTLTWYQALRCLSANNMSWKTLTEIDQIENIIEESYETPCVILKHSTTCSISYAAKMRLDSDLDDLSSIASMYYLDLLSYRPVSKAVAEKLQVHHESPQVIVIKNGEVIYDESHLDITSAELSEQIAL